MKLTEFLRKEINHIQERYNFIHRDIYSKPAEGYRVFVNLHSNDIQGHKDRLEEIMELTESKVRIEKILNNSQ